MTTVLAVVQARMGSTRLPGKVLAELNGEPLLEFLLRRLRAAPLDAVTVATSDRSIDDAVAALAAKVGVDIVRGSEEDVLARFAVAVEAHPADHIVRITADCPLTDASIVRRAIDVHLANGADYTSNTLVRTYPDGLDVEVIRTTALLAAAVEAASGDEREHVTPFLYRRPRRFRLASFVHEAFLGDLRWTVDTEDDLQHVRELAKRLPSPLAPWTTLISASDQSIGAVALLPARSSTPQHRRWDLLRGNVRAGAVDVSIDDGVGTATFDLDDSADLALVEHLLRSRLSADRQVCELRLPGQRQD